MRILITGVAGFIGFNLALKLIKKGYSIAGVDNLNNYYDINLKKARLDRLFELSENKKEIFKFSKIDIKNKEALINLFNDFQPEYVFNLAAQAGVRYSIENPSAYIESNIVGFSNILECCRNLNIKHLIYASSSSVYGGNKNMPFSEKHGVDHPISLYAATKKSNELMAHCYSHLYSLPSTGLRFFTVYGPWGRPDMALFLFTKAILNKEPIKVFNNGNMIRDFTYIDDICESLLRLMNKPPFENNNFDFINPDPSKSWTCHRIFNIGNSKPIALLDYIEAIENVVGIKAKKEMYPLQPGDVTATSANTKLLEEWINFKPNTSIQEGVNKFVNWYREFYKI